MSIESTYREILVEEFIKEQLKKGVAVSATDVESQITATIDTKNLSIPQFVAADFYSDRRSSASAVKFNSTFKTIKQDLTTLYRNMIVLTKVSTDAHERWGVEAETIEKRLIDLENRVENLLLLTQNTEGYHSFVLDNFTDTTLIDLTLSSILVDLRSGIIALQPTGGTTAKLFLNDLSLSKDLSFRVRSTANFIGRRDSQTGDLRDVFTQESATWWTSVEMKKVEPVTCELTVKLTADTSVDISRIFLSLHESSQSSPMVITPLYSLDNINFKQLPTNTFSQEIRNTGTFSFSEVAAKWVKFIFIKPGPDPTVGQDFFSYQFGFKEISFFQEIFTINTAQCLISRPLSVVANDDTREKFEKLTLEVCERVETNTTIRWYVTTSNTSTVPISSSTLWVPISPVGRESPIFPVILDVGETLVSTFGDTEGETVDTEIVKISYSGLAADTDFVNPAAAFNLLSDDGSGGITDTSTTASSKRYTFVNTNDRILNYQLQDNIDISLPSLQLFRNIGIQGLDPTLTSSLVRSIQRGWRFEDPWYITVIEVQNALGFTIDVGEQVIIIDDIRYTGTVDNTVLTGKSTNDTGLHRIRVHKTNWHNVTPDLNSLATLKATDPIYPFNHKMLIEGYAYGSTYPSTEEKIYQGADIYAETIMTKVSKFDIVNSVEADNYDLFALDLDAPSTHTGGNNASTVFVVKVDEKNPDFQNERFMIRFNLVNQLRTYLRVRADLSTTDSKITPSIDSYQVKLA